MDEKMMDEKEKEYMNYALTVIKDKAYELFNFTQGVLIKDKSNDFYEDIDPVKITMELEPLQEAINSALNQFYRRYPVRRTQYPTYYLPHYQSYQPNKN